MQRKKKCFESLFIKKIEKGSSFLTDIWNHGKTKGNKLCTRSKDRGKGAFPGKKLKNCLTVQEVFDNGFIEDYDQDFWYDEGDKQNCYVNDFVFMTSRKACDSPYLRLLTLFPPPTSYDKDESNGNEKAESLQSTFWSTLYFYKPQKKSSRSNPKTISPPGSMSPTRPPPKPPRNKTSTENQDLNSSVEEKDIFSSSTILTTNFIEDLCDTVAKNKESVARETSCESTNFCESLSQNVKDPQDTSDCGGYPKSDWINDFEQIFKDDLSHQPEPGATSQFNSHEYPNQESPPPAGATARYISHEYQNQESAPPLGATSRYNSHEHQNQESPPPLEEYSDQESPPPPEEYIDQESPPPLDVEFQDKPPAKPKDANVSVNTINEQFTRNQQMLHDLARTENLTVHDVIPDGNCMFRAIVDQLRMQGEITITCNKIRKMAVEYLRENPLQEDGTHMEDFFVAGDESWEQYLTRMSKDGEWGDQIMLRGVSEVLQREICIISIIGDVHNQTSINHKNSNDKTKLVLGHVNDQHYYSLRPKKWQDVWYREATKIKYFEQKPVDEDIVNGEETPDNMLPGNPLCKPSKLINCTLEHIDKYSGIPIFHLSFIIENVLQKQSFMTPHMYYVRSPHLRIWKKAGFELVGSVEEELAVNIHTVMSVSPMRNENFNAYKVNDYPNLYVKAGKCLAIYQSDSTESQTNVAIIDTQNTQPGYARLQLHDKTSEPIYRDINGEKYASHSYKKQKAHNLPTKNITKPFEKQNTTVLYYNKCSRWPNETNEWISRDRPSGWPHRNIITDVLEVPVVLTPDPHFDSKHPTIEWRFDFSFPELHLLKDNISHHQRYCFHVFKLLMDFHTGRMRQLSTFLLKTIFLYTLEILPQHQWEIYPGACVLYMVDTLLSGLKQKWIPHYFISKNNIIGHLNGSIIYRLIEKVNVVREYPILSVLLMAEGHHLASASIADTIVEDVYVPWRNFQDSIQDVFIPLYTKIISTNLLLEHFQMAARASVKGHNLLHFVSESHEEGHINPYSETSLDSFISQSTHDFALFQKWWLCFFVDFYEKQNLLSTFITIHSSSKTIGELMKDCPQGDLDNIRVPNYIIVCYRDFKIGKAHGFLHTLCVYLFQEREYQQCVQYHRGLVQLLSKAIEDPETAMTVNLTNFSDERFEYKLESYINEVYSHLFYALNRLFLCYQYLGQAEYFQEYIEQFETVCDVIATPLSFQCLEEIWDILGSREKMIEAREKKRCLQN